jgi:hypothetical protein
MLQERSGSSSDELECDSWQPDAIDVALQHRGHSIPPRWEHEDKAFALKKSLDLARHERPVFTHMMVGQPLLTREYGLKALRIKIAVVNVMASSGQGLHHASMEGALVAIVDRVCVNHKKSHFGLSSAQLANMESGLISYSVAGNVGDTRSVEE